MGNVVQNASKKVAYLGSYFLYNTKGYTVHGTFLSKLARDPRIMQEYISLFAVYF